MLLCCACSAEPDRDVEEFQKDKDTVAQLDTALKKLEAADSFHLKQENEKGQLVDLSIRKSSSTEDTTAKPNDVYAPYEFSGTYTDEKGASFHIEQTKQSGLMAQVNIADTGLLPQGFNTIRWDKQTFEQTLENAALETMCVSAKRMMINCIPVRLASLRLSSKRMQMDISSIIKAAEIKLCEYIRIYIKKRYTS